MEHHAADTAPIKLTLSGSKKRSRLNVPLRFSELCQQVRSIFPDIKDFNLQYVDDEGDNINVTSDEDLEEARSVFKDLGRVLSFIVDAKTSATDKAKSYPPVPRTVSASASKSIPTSKSAATTKSCAGRCGHDHWRQMARVFGHSDILNEAMRRVGTAAAARGGSPCGIFAEAMKCVGAATARANPPASRTEGAVVELHSLSTKALNGRRGLCGRFDQQKGRYQVELFATDTAAGRTVAVRTRNLKPVTFGTTRTSEECEQLLPTNTPFGPGSSGPDVVMLQKVLIQLGYMHPSAIRWHQGFYGPRTTEAVAKVSKAIGCTSGGVFTDRVRAHLLKERLAKAAEEQAKAKAAKVEAERLAEEEAAKNEAERLAKAAEEQANVKAERLAAEEAAKKEAERLAKAAEEHAKAKAAKVEAQRLAEEEAAKKEAERLAKAVEAAMAIKMEAIAREEAAKKEAERLAKEVEAEAERLAEAKAAKMEAQRLAKEQAAKVKAERLAEEAAIKEAERLAKAAEAAAKAKSRAAEAEGKHLVVEENKNSDTTIATSHADPHLHLQDEKKPANNQPALDCVFVRDISIPDGKVVPAGKKFTKTWLVKTGANGWPAGCALVHISGDSMGAPPSIDLSPQQPNTLVEVSVNFSAPTRSGEATSKWRVAGPDDALFGHAMWTTIAVKPLTAGGSAASMTGAENSPTLSASSSSPPVSPLVQQLIDMGFTLPVEMLAGVLDSVHGDLGAAVTALC